MTSKLDILLGDIDPDKTLHATNTRIDEALNTFPFESAYSA